MSRVAQHGTRSKYTGGCRCEECRTANAAYGAAFSAVKRTKGLPKDDPRHGTTNGYSNYGCRCSECRKANATAQREYQHSRAKVG